MATINATLNINTSDLTSSPINFTKTMTMTKAGTNTGLELTSGLIRRKLTATTLIDLVTVGAQMYGTPGASKANKLYIKNTGSSSTEYIDVAIGDSESDSGEELLATGGNSKITLGRLYGGEWMLIPFEGTSNNDIIVAPNTAETTTIEWMLYFEV
jgi:hypothetical protein|tara:strand:+ start:1315 stop:1782 length:468 start_codon:yes stop_codon:yes gene_type:complete